MIAFAVASNLSLTTSIFTLSGQGARAALKASISAWSEAGLSEFASTKRKTNSR